MFPQNAMFPTAGMMSGFRPQTMYPPQLQPSSPQMLPVTMVTGMAQVEAAQVSFDGTPAFFYDTAADALYVKQFNPQNGTSPVTIYRREAPTPAPQWATVDMVNALAERLDAMTAPRARRKEADVE